jgi:amidohydrolase
MGVVADGVDPATAPSNHSPLFNVEEKYLEKGTRALTHLVVDYLESHTAE